MHMHAKAYHVLNSNSARSWACVLPFLFRVVVPVSIGAAIYLFFRTTSLLVFHWLSAVNLLEPTLIVRGWLAEITLPNWLLYSVPDGLWVYAVTSWMILIWQRRPPFLWLFVGVALGLGGELGQAIGIVPGTYQHLDIVSYIAGFLLACLHLEYIHETSPIVRFRIAGNDRVRVWERRHE